MSSEWATLTIGDLIRQGEAIVQTGPFGSQLHSHDYVDAGTPVIPTEAIGRGRILDVAVPQVGLAKASELARHRLLRGDILFARRGAQATGLAAIVDSRFEGALCGTGALLLRVKSLRVDSDYLSMFLSSDFSYNWLRTHAVGAVMPNINTEIIKALPLVLPSIEEQRNLAQFSGAIDARIALLRETNATLEAIAQALFKSWFVDFDPVYAKQQGTAPAGMDDATAALFPDGFEESALGLVPKGWPILTIGDIAQRIGMGPFGSDIKVSTFLPKGVPVLNGKNVQGLLLDDGCANFIAESHADRLNKSCVQAGDIVVTHRGTLGQVSLVPEGLAYEKFVASQSQFFLRCDLKKSTPEWAT